MEIRNPKIKTKVVHSQTKDAWNVVGIEPGKKYKICIVPYIVVPGNEVMTHRYKNEAYEHAEFISFNFNKV